MLFVFSGMSACLVGPGRESKSVSDPSAFLSTPVDRGCYSHGFIYRDQDKDG